MCKIMFQLSIERTPTYSALRTFLFRFTILIQHITLVTSTSGQDNNNININQLHRRNNYNNESGYSTIMDNYSTDYGLIEMQTDDYNYRYKIVDDTTIFPVAVSMFCPMYNVFNPIWVVPELDSYPSLLCNSVIPNQTLVQFRSTFQTSNFEGPVAVVVTYDSNFANCSVDDIMTNVERINAIPNGVNNISHLIIPKSYRSDIYSNQNQYTTDSLNDMDPCMYSNIIPLYAEDNLTVQLQSDMKSRQKEQDTNADTLSEKFLMMIGYDVNNDGIINWDDYDSYNYYPGNSGSYYGGSSSSGSTSNNTTVWIIFLTGFCVLFCCLVRYQIRKNEGEAHRRRRQQQAASQSGNTSTTAAASPTSTTGQDVSIKKPVVTEAEFGTLPQITYRVNRNRSSKSLLQPSFNVSEDNGEIPTIPITLVTCGINTDDAQNDKFTGEKGVVFENDIANNPTEAAKVTPKTLQYEDDNVKDESGINNDGFNTNQNLSYHKIMKYNSQQQSFGIISRSDCCCICLEEFQDNEIITALPRCLHLFHTNCIGEWLLLQKKNTCPLCKTTILLNDDDGTSTEV